MNHKMINQTHDSPYHQLRGGSTKADKYRHNEIARRILTENETPSQQKQPRFGTRKPTINDGQDLFGPQKDDSNINNYNNIHINIHHNEFVNQRKYFPTLQSKLLGQQSKYQKTQPEEVVLRTPMSTTNKSQNRQQHQSLHENLQDVRNKDMRSTSSHIHSTHQPKKRLNTNESFDATHSSNLDGSKNYQNMIISQIRDRKDFTVTQATKALTSQMKGRSISNTKKLNTTKKGNFLLDMKKPSLLDQSLEIAESQKQYNIPMTTTNKTITPSQQRTHHHSFSQSNNQIQKSTFKSALPNKMSAYMIQTPSNNNRTNSSKLLDPQTTKNASKQKQSSQERQKTEVQATVLNQVPQPTVQPIPKRVHPKVLWDMSDEEWDIFGDRFPIQFDKKKLLGRGGFSLVWLGEHRKTKETFAIKQILSNNTHQSHMKEIWFGTYFFEAGYPKEKFASYPGGKNLVRFLAYDVKPQDTWIFYEICGDSLGNHLYDLKGENQGQERIYRIQHRSLYQTLRKDNTLLKKLLSELALALDLLSEQRIVHSDLKTENILIKTERLPNGMHQLSQIKLIDYGSSFPFDDLKQFSMATPEYMCPEILNYILYENSLNYHQALLKYLNNYQKPWVIDIWSLGCVILEIISGIPLWMSLKTLVNHKGKEQIEYGLFAVKGRVFEKIIERQIEVVSNLDHYLDHQTFGGLTIDQDLKYLLKRMLSLNPEKRISPKEIIQFLDPKKNEILYTQ